MASSYFDTGVHRWAIVPNESDTELDQVKIKYIDARPTTGSTPNGRGVILLIHGFPETSYQFRKVIGPLVEAGYRVVAPDYRGAGESSKPMNLDGYRKQVMAADLRYVVREELGIKDKIHVVGHDIGGMVAHAYASQFEDDTASVAWGECPLPGTTFYHDTKGSMPLFHFNFHNVMDLPEALTKGNERIYLKHFFDRLSYNKSAITPADLDLYASLYSHAGGMRAGFNVYRMFERDGKDNVKLRDEKGKCKVRCLLLNGTESFLGEVAKQEGEEFYETYEVGKVEESSHWIAEENPKAFVREVLKFIEK